MKKLFTALFVLFLVSISLAAAEWHIETVDAEGYTGDESSLALASSGRPRIAYHFNYGFNYARWDDEWLIENPDPGMNGKYLSMVLDANNHPHIAYFFYTAWDLKYTRWDGDEWLIETVDSAADVGTYNSIALDSSDRPHISYFDYTNYNLKYTRWDGDEWLVETVDSTGEVGGYTSIALDGSGHPHISYAGNLTSYDLKYARWDGDEWLIETVDSAGDVGWYTSLALDDSGYPHISYYDNSEGLYDLKYARWDGADWQIEIVDEAGDMGMYSSLALDSNDYPHISYYDFDDKDLAYARWDGDEWLFETVDSAGNVGEYTSLAIDSYDNPHISYFDHTNADLKYAWYGDLSAVEDVELSANVRDEGVLVGWTITGDSPAGLRVLRGESEPEAISGSIPGSAVRWLDRNAYEASGKGLKPLVYWLEVTEADGRVTRFGPTEVVTFPGAARELALSVYPSPAADSLTVDYTLPGDGEVTISLYDLSGRRVSTLFDGETAAGRHDISCDASALTPGVYLVYLDSCVGTLTRRVVIAR